VTTIIGIQGDSYAVICADSRVTEVDSDGLATQSMSLKEVGFKIAQNGRWLMGVAGDVRAINILTHSFNPPIPPPSLKGRKLDHFVTTKFIPAMRICFDAEGYSTPVTESSEHQSEHGSVVMAAINGTIYVIDGDYSWLSDSFGVYAIGSGAQFALGSLATTIPTGGKIGRRTARQSALKAMGVAGRYDPGTAAPYHVLIQEATQRIVKKPVKANKATVPKKR
jgi:ATP-dependent protease HslVU (ClpYQ) peptidase subunit